MKVEEKGHTIIIKDTQGDSNKFLEKLTAEYNSFKDKNLVLDLSRDAELSLNAMLAFLPISNKHRKAKKTLVLVAPNFDYDDAPDEMIIVPTLLEAHDVIEMEEIERDLGF
jgi:hypothetical protein